MSFLCMEPVKAICSKRGYQTDKFSVYMNIGPIWRKFNRPTPCGLKYAVYHKQNNKLIHKKCKQLTSMAMTIPTDMLEIVNNTRTDIDYISNAEHYITALELRPTFH